ncbi:hypothetical protein [Kitasatospora sp. GP82]|uniref:hypothetical protein n=1 Tax=Kitasatospora sp. GP82 TaxID=3035089 RepID=UPI0024759AF8|nr:hypothetical protein [Kitasatospora sp. GP82]MDH6130531.1 hypothetical protein [Kitasatospora sp. GP82]
MKCLFRLALWASDVALTPQAASALASGTAAGANILREIFGSLPDAELALLDRVLDAIDTAMATSAGKPEGHGA